MFLENIVLRKYKLTDLDKASVNELVDFHPIFTVCVQSDDQIVIVLLNGSTKYVSMHAECCLPLVTAYYASQTESIDYCYCRFVNSSVNFIIRNIA